LKFFCFLFSQATLLRESQIPETQRQADLLEKICANGCRFDNLVLLLLLLCGSLIGTLLLLTRERAAFPAPAAGLCMTGVGYDLEDLSKSKFLPTNPKTIARNKRKKEEKEEQERLLAESSKKIVGTVAGGEVEVEVASLEESLA
jgi:hypothetical protein